MAQFLLIFAVLQGLVVAWAVAVRVRQRSKRKGEARDVSATDSEGHYASELEHRKRLDVRASRWPGPVPW